MILTTVVAVVSFVVGWLIGMTVRRSVRRKIEDGERYRARRGGVMDAIHLVENVGIETARSMVNSLYRHMEE